MLKQRVLDRPLSSLFAVAPLYLTFEYLNLAFNSWWGSLKTLEHVNDISTRSGSKKLFLTAAKQEVYSYLGSQHNRTLRFFPWPAYSIACHRYVRQSWVHCSLTFSLVISWRFLKANQNGQAWTFDFLEKPRLTIELTSPIKGEYIFCKDLTVYC